ncbi:MAG: ATP-dependent nuclease, partial [Nitrososphaera sp.]
MGTSPRTNIYFGKTGVRVHIKGSNAVYYDTESTKSYVRQGVDGTIRTVMELAKNDTSSDANDFFNSGFHIQGTSPPRYREVYVARINNNNDYADYGPEHALFVSELLGVVGNSHLSSETLFEDLIGSFLRKKILFTSELRGMQQKPLGSDETLNPDGSNLANYLFQLSTNEDNNLQRLYGKICDDFAQIFESNKVSLRVVLLPAEKKETNKMGVTNIPKIYVYDNVLQDQLPLENVGSGIFEVIYLLTRSLTQSSGVIILDEPALHLHPAQINVFKRFLLQNAKASDNQLVIITHSPAFIGKDIVEKRTQIIYFRRRDGITEIRQAGEEDKQWIQEHLPKLRFEFNPNIFFAKSVV